MKFDVVVGNPPYQESQNNNNYSEPIYPYFYDLAEKTAGKYSLISPARFLYGVGATKAEWNNKMLNDVHLKVIFYEQNSANVFSNTDIMGGVAVLYRDVQKIFGAIGTFSSFEELNTILHKVVIANKKWEEFGNLIFVQTKFVLEKLYQDFPDFKNRLGSEGKDRRLRQAAFDLLPEIFFDAKQNDKQVQIYGRQKNDRVYKWIDPKYLDNGGNFGSWKVFVPAANGSGAIGEILSTPIIGQPVIGQPVIGHTQTFISIGNFKTEFEAQALLKYLKSKFSRAMLGIKKTTQDNKAKDTWSKVPPQDFTPHSDIDWTKSIPEIDRQLYAKYGLDEKEIAFIEEKIKPME